MRWGGAGGDRRIDGARYQEGSDSSQADFLEAEEGEASFPSPISFCSPVLEKIRSAGGSTQLLLSQKVQQFFRLCQQSMVSGRGRGAPGVCAW